MKRDFSFYEFAGVLLPGAVLLLGCLWVNPDTKDLIVAKDHSTGSFGIFVIAAYIAGHLIQALGNLIESLAWKHSGKPTHWITKASPKYLSSDQIAALPDAIAKLTGRSAPNLATLTKEQTNSLRGQLAARLDKEGRATRMEAFNGNYGMFRGITAASIVVALYGLVSSNWNWCAPEFYAPLILAALAAFRFYRFGVHYAAELYWQVLDCAQHLDEPTVERAAVSGSPTKPHPPAQT